MTTPIQLLKHIPTIISCGSTNRNEKGELRKLSLTHYEGNNWRATYLLDDIGDRKMWTENGVFVKSIPVVDGGSLLDVLQKLDEKLKANQLTR